MGEGSGLNVATGGRLGRESDRVIRPLKLGNAGGGKDPDLYGAFDVNLFSISYSFSHLIYSHLTEVTVLDVPRGTRRSARIIAPHTCIRWVDETRTMMQ